MTTDRAVIEGLFEDVDGGARLIGTRCTSCGALHFPRAVSCRNPDCRQKRVERALLPDRGTLYSFTIQRYAPPPAFAIDDWAPYALGLVDLGRGLLVLGMMTGVAFDAIRIGMPLRTVTAPLFRDQHGATTTYMFAPEPEVA